MKKKLILTHFQTKDIVFETEIAESEEIRYLTLIQDALNGHDCLTIGFKIISYHILKQCITSIEEVKEEEKPQIFPLYGKCNTDKDNSCCFSKGKIYKIISETQNIWEFEKDNEGDENGWSKEYFDLVPESEYLKQEGKEKQ
jgi:hypothetical protein